MSFATITTDLKTYFTNNFADATIDIFYENQYNVPTIDKTFIKFYVLTGNENPLNVGKTLRDTRKNGNIQIEIFEPNTQGDTKTLSLFDSITTIFRNKNISDIITGWPETNKNIENKDGYMRSLINIPFYKNILV